MLRLLAHIRYPVRLMEMMLLFRFLVPVLLLLVGVGFIWAMERLHRRRELQKLRSSWGRMPAERRLQAEQARLLHDLCGDDEHEQESCTIDERTWSDLDLDEMMRRLDRTISPMGAQTLYRLLRRPQLSQGVLDLRREVIDRLRRDRHLREQTQLSLLPLRHSDAVSLPRMLWREPPEYLPLAFMLPLLALAAMATIGLAWFEVLSWFWVVVAFAVNLVVFYWLGRWVDTASLRALALLLDSGSALAVFGDRLHLEPMCGEVAGSIRQTAALARKLAPLRVDDSWGVLQYVKILFLVDLIAYRSAVGLIRRHARPLRTIFEAVGMVDALLAVASWCDQHPGYCWPSFLPDEAGTCRLVGLHHPLLEQPVRNDFSFRRRAVIITGSNMSGKTTFLKTVGVNAVLAQTLHLVAADAYEMPFVRVITSIGRADNLIEGRSYYLAEVESILRLVQAARSQAPHLLIADEVFRGTNPDERVAGASEVLRHLATNHHFVFAATHDISVVELLESSYDSFYFGERLDASGLSFDYTIRPGLATGRNAIALLEFAGYPEELVERAKALAERLR